MLRECAATCSSRWALARASVSPCSTVRRASRASLMSCSPRARAGRAIPGSSPTPPFRGCWRRCSPSARAGRGSTRSSWAARACSPSAPGASRSASATTRPCATQLAKLRIPIAAAETGGSCGRTVRVFVEDGRRDLARRGRHRGRAVSPDSCEGGGMSGQVLSPDAIAALVEAAKEGRLPEESSADRSRQRRMRTVDFTRPTKFTSDQERRIKRGARDLLPHGVDAPLGRAAHAARARGHQREPAHVGQRPRPGAGALGLLPDRGPRASARGCC